MNSTQLKKIACQRVLEALKFFELAGEFEVQFVELDVHTGQTVDAPCKGSVSCLLFVIEDDEILSDEDFDTAHDDYDMRYDTWQNRGWFMPI